MQEKTQYRMILFFGVLSVTSSSFIIRFAHQPSYALAFSRVLFTGIVAYFLIGRRYGKPLIPDKRDTLKIFFAGLSLATHFGWWFDSLNYISIGASLSLTNTAPVWLAIFLFLIYHVQIKKRQWFSICLVIIGSLVLFIDSPIITEDGEIGLLLALGSAIGFATYLLVARDLVPKYGLWKYFGLVNLASALIFVPWLILNGEIEHTITLDLWIWGLVLALIPGIMGHAVYNYSMSKLNPVDVGIATLGEPILGTIFAYLIFNEFLTPLQLLAIFVLLVAIVFSMDLQRDTQSIKRTGIQNSTKRDED